MVSGTYLYLVNITSVTTRIYLTWTNVARTNVSGEEPGIIGMTFRSAEISHARGQVVIAC